MKSIVIREVAFHSSGHRLIRTNIVNSTDSFAIEAEILREALIECKGVSILAEEIDGEGIFLHISRYEAEIGSIKHREELLVLANAGKSNPLFLGRIDAGRVLSAGLEEDCRSFRDLLLDLIDGFLEEEAVSLSIVHIDFYRLLHRVEYRVMILPCRSQESYLRIRLLVLQILVNHGERAAAGYCLGRSDLSQQFTTKSYSVQQFSVGSKDQLLSQIQIVAVTSTRHVFLVSVKTSEFFFSFADRSEDVSLACVGSVHSYGHVHFLGMVVAVESFDHSKDRISRTLSDRGEDVLRAV